MLKCAPGTESTLSIRVTEVGRRLVWPRPPNRSTWSLNGSSLVMEGARSQFCVRMTLETSLAIETRMYMHFYHHPIPISRREWRAQHPPLRLARHHSRYFFSSSVLPIVPAYRQNRCMSTPHPRFEVVCSWFDPIGGFAFPARKNPIPAKYSFHFEPHPFRDVDRLGIQLICLPLYPPQSQPREWNGVRGRRKIKSVLQQEPNCIGGHMRALERRKHNNETDLGLKMNGAGIEVANYPCKTDLRWCVGWGGCGWMRAACLVDDGVQDHGRIWTNTAFN